MHPKQDIPERILRTLNHRPRGLTITEITKVLGVNRNLVSKHLEVMQAAGQVESRLVGNAKVYSLARRVPLSTFLCFTKNLILTLDADLAIVEVSNQCLAWFGRSREDVVGQNLREAALPVVSDPEVLAAIEDLEQEQVIAEIPCRQDGGRESFYNMQAIPTTFGDGAKGCTIVLEDITERKRYLSNTMFLTRTAIDLVDLQPVEDICDYTVSRLLELVPGTYACIFTYSEAGHRFAIRAVAGEGFREGLTELLGRDPVGLILPATRFFDAPYYETPLSMRGLQEFTLRPEPSLWPFYDLCFRAIPEEVCEAILERFGIGRLCATGLVWRDRLYGIAGIFLPSGREVESRETVESFLRQVSIAIARRETGEQLRLSEARFRGMLDASPFGVALIDHEGRFTYTNRQFADIFGYEPEIATRVAEWLRLIFPDDGDRQGVIDTWCSDPERSVPGWIRPRTFTIQIHDGTKKTVFCRAVTLPGGMEYITCEDITEEFRIHRLLLADIADLRRREQELLIKDRAIASTRRAVALLSRDGVVTYANAAYLALWGHMTAERIPGSHFSCFWEHPDEIQEIIRIVLGGRAWHGELTAIDADGRAFLVDLLATPIIGKDDVVLGVMAAVTAGRSGDAEFPDRILEEVPDTANR